MHVTPHPCAHHTHALLGTTPPSMRALALCAPHRAERTHVRLMSMARLLPLLTTRAHTARTSCAHPSQTMLRGAAIPHGLPRCATPRRVSCSGCMRESATACRVERQRVVVTRMHICMAEARTITRCTQGSIVRRTCSGQHPLAGTRSHTVRHYDALIARGACAPLDRASHRQPVTPLRT